MKMNYLLLLGRITGVKASRNGSVRQAEVKTAMEILQRLASKLAILVRGKLKDRSNISAEG